MKAALSILLLLAAPLALAQAPAPAAPASTGTAVTTDPCASAPQAAFDVATVKPSTQPSGNSSINTHPDSLAADGSVSRMIQFACNLHEFQLSGGPDWVNTATWEVVAKVDQPPADWPNLNSDTRDNIQRQRLQAVLAQRFALKCHFETKDLPVDNLVLAKSGSKLTPTPADGAKKGGFSSYGNNGKNRMQANGIAIDALVAHLSQSLGRTVIDKTGLTGLYDLTLTFTSDADAASPSSHNDSASGPTLFTALEEQLGLKLESSRGPVPILVIDSITRPSEN
jgi:uncharacterized protein (TIGR03435 family)